MDFPGEPWVRTREGRVALPKGGEGDMLHSQLVKLGQLQGRKEVRANQSKWIISEELITTIQSQSDDYKYHRWCRTEEAQFVLGKHAGVSWQSLRDTQSHLSGYGAATAQSVASRGLRRYFNQGMPLLLLSC